MIMTPKTFVALLSLAAASASASVVTPRASKYYVNLWFGGETWNTCTDVANAAAVLTAEGGCAKLEFHGTGATCVVPDTKCATFKHACDAFGGKVPKKMRC
ncbi:hypothetical protein HGRIS_003179 [Hohenbuehelia grisea]|uniref:Uncharacterized protein n=1 Tax=Hohenbuehelia grisea TaxID=104357 RepID=A0ABR3JP51_9AGAR